MHNEKDENRLIYAILLCFILAALLGLPADFYGGGWSKQIIYKSVDALFITGSILVAMKLAREGWDLAAAGYTVLSIAWGVLFFAKDFQEQNMGYEILISAFYFLLPSMILIAFYEPFPLFIKILCIISVIPSFIGLIYIKQGRPLADYQIWVKINYQAVHIISLFWGFFFYRQHKKNNRNQVNR